MRNLRIVLDTNFLMIPENHNVDIFRELDRVVDRKYELVVPEIVIKELEHLSQEGTPSEKKAAKIALDLSSRANKIPSEISEADQEILRLAREEGYPVATDDSDLREKVRKAKTPVIFLRQSNHLAIDGTI